VKFSSVRKWLQRLDGEWDERNTSAYNAVRIFRRWLGWLNENDSELSSFSPDQLVLFQQEHRDYTMLDLVQGWVGEAEGRATYKDKLYTVIRSFFLHNRAELPKDKSFRIRGDMAPVRGDLAVEEIRRVVEASNPCMRAVFMSMVMGWMGWDEIDYWSSMGLETTRRKLSTGEYPLKVDLPGRKSQRNRVPYYTYIGRDAIDALRSWLAIRPNKGTHIFMTTFGTPLTYGTARAYWTRKLKRLGIIVPKESSFPDPRGVRYGKNLHEIRDVSRTRARYAVPDGFDIDFAEFFMGHSNKVDPLKYDKIMRDYDWSRDMYLKVEPWLNIITADPQRVDAKEVRVLQRRITELEGMKEEFENLKTMVKASLDRYKIKEEGDAIE